MSKNAIVHVELPAEDPKAAAEFYNSVFDWNVQRDPTFDYWVWGADGSGGGFNKIGPSTQEGGLGFEVKPREVLVYISTDDIEGTLAKIESVGGGVVTPKTEIPGMGHYAIFRDPSGNRVGLFSGGPPSQ